MSLTKLVRQPDALTVYVAPDDVTASVIKVFDLSPDAPVEFFPWARPALPDSWGIGVIVGASGSGKSTLLKEFGRYVAPRWAPARSIASYFPDADTAIEMFNAVGLNSVPTWRKPYAVLSTGEKFRADLARSVRSGAVVDEFTSVVSRSVAKSASRALRGHVKHRGLTGLVIATCHRDVIPWLAPDWVIDTDEGTVLVGRSYEEQWSVTGLERVGSITLNIS